MNVTVTEAGRESAETIGRLLQLYLYEMGDHTAEEIGEDGLFAYPYFSVYWTEPEREPLLIHADGRLAGFVFTREVAPGVRDMAEFFVLRAWRRRGVGRDAARQVLDRHRGAWEIRYFPGNGPAAALWESVAAERAGVWRGVDGGMIRLRVEW